MYLNSNIYLDEVKKVIFTNLIESKISYNKAKKTENQWKYTSFFFLACFILYFTYFTLLPAWPLPNKMLALFLDDRNHLFLILLCVGSFGIFGICRKKYDKADKEFHALRCEVIRRSEELWPTDREWEERFKLYEWIEKEHDINLYHEN